MRDTFVFSVALLTYFSFTTFLIYTADGMRAHGDDPIKAGMWLYRLEKQSERKSCDKWDPGAPFALAVVAPSKVGGDPGRNCLNLHFGGRESFLGNVVFKYHAGGAESRMDCR